MGTEDFDAVAKKLNKARYLLRERIRITERAQFLEDQARKAVNDLRKERDEIEARWEKEDA